MEPPKITCPSDIQANNSLHQSYAVITWTEPDYSDNSIGVDPLAEVTLTSNFKSGQKFLIGSYFVEYTITDRVGLVARCSFVVKVFGQYFLSQTDRYFNNFCFMFPRLVLHILSPRTHKPH